MDPNQLPKGLRKYADKIDDYSDERQSENGIWIYYVPFLKSSTDPIGCLHQEHEDTIGELVSLVKRCLPCDCEDCKKQIP